MPHIVAACCTLHNIVETKGDKLEKNWLQQQNGDDLLFPQPENVEKREDVNNGTQVRNTLLNIVSRLPRRRSLRN